MTFRNRFMKWTAVSVFAVLVAVGLVGAQEDKNQPHKKVKSGKHHVEKKGEGPVVDNWKIKRHYKDTAGKEHDIDFGTANVTLNPDGSWNFSGQMNQNHVGSGCRFYIVFAVKSSEGTSVAFRQSAVLEQENPQSYSWERQGTNRTIKDNFKSFAKSHDWAGHWTCVGLPQARSGGSDDPNWGNIISGVGTTLGTPLSFFL